MLCLGFHSPQKTSSNRYRKGPRCAILITWFSNIAINFATLLCEHAAMKHLLLADSYLPFDPILKKDNDDIH